MTNSGRIEPKAAIRLAIAAAELRARQLREAYRVLERIAGKRKRTIVDEMLHEQMCRRLLACELAVPPEWRDLAW